MSPTKTTNLSMRINNSSTACDTEYEKSTQTIDVHFNELSYFLPVRIRFLRITQSCILWSHFGVEQAVHGSTTSYSSPSAAFSLRVCDRILPCVSGNAPPRKAVAKIETTIGCSWWMMVLNFGKGGRMQAVHIVRCRTLIPRQHGVATEERIHLFCILPGIALLLQARHTLFSSM